MKLGPTGSSVVSSSGSKYAPPRPETVPTEMAALGRWLADVSVPDDDAFAGVSGLLAAATAHTWFVTVHPFIDGNGRVARLLMNLMLMRHGYPIAVIAKEDRLRYYDALEFSQASDLTPFIVLLAECIEESLEEYEVWRNAMELFKSHLQQTVAALDQAADYGHVYLKDFGNLEFEKYAALRRGESAKRTWFIRVDFRRGDASARYLFFFGNANHAMRDRCQVTLHVAREEPPGSFNYERLEHIRSENVPELAEVGYDMSKERFVVRGRNNRPRMAGLEDLTKRFFESIVKTHFGA